MGVTTHIKFKKNGWEYIDTDVARLIKFNLNIIIN
jgi:hypothetical protein